MRLVFKLIKQPLKLVDRICSTDHAVRMHNRQIGFHTTDYRFEPAQTALIHVPKCAGTAAHRTLARDPEKRFVGLDMHRPVSRHCPPGRYRYLTILRDPVPRVWSYYQMVLRNGPGYPYHRFALKGLEFFLEHCWEARNLACRYYSGRMGEPDEAALGLALDNLARFEMVILFDRFADQFMAYVQNKGILVDSIPHARKSRYAQPAKEEARLITRHNRLDLELCRRWMERV